MKRIWKGGFGLVSVRSTLAERFVATNTPICFLHCMPRVPLSILRHSTLFLLCFPERGCLCASVDSSGLLFCILKDQKSVSISLFSQFSQLSSLSLSACGVGVLPCSHQILQHSMGQNTIIPTHCIAERRLQTTARAAAARSNSTTLQHSNSSNSSNSNSRSSRSSSQEKKSGSRSSAATDITTGATTSQLFSEPDKQASRQR